MFDLFSSMQNPFVAMMNMDEDDEENSSEFESPSGGFGFPVFPNMYSGMDENGMGMNPMLFMQQAFMMHMMFMQSMCMMPLWFMKGMADMMKNIPVSDQEADKSAADSAPSQEDGLKLGNMNIPPELLYRLLQMDMSPENLEKLQKVLDVVFAAIPESKDNGLAGENYE